MELASATGVPSSESAHSASAPSTPYVDGGASNKDDSDGGSVYEDGQEAGMDDLANSPLVLPSTGAGARVVEVPELLLDTAEVKRGKAE